MNLASATHQKTPFLVPTVTKQSWYFIIGGSLFAIGSAASIWDFSNSAFTNWVCFIGAWFFTTAGLIQLILSGDATVAVRYGLGKSFRAEWIAAATQTFGTLLFNVSTTASLTATSLGAQKHYVWNPDAGGSVAFLVSAFFVYVAFYRAESTLWAPSNPGWWSAHVNMLGCLAFGLSAVGAFILNDGTSENAALANWGTFIGAICFVVASAMALPQLPWNRASTAAAPSAPAQETTDAAHS